MTSDVQYERHVYGCVSDSSSGVTITYETRTTEYVVVSLCQNAPVMILFVGLPPLCWDVPLNDEPLPVIKDRCSLNPLYQTKFWECQFVCH